MSGHPKPPVVAFRDIPDGALFIGHGRVHPSHTAYRKYGDEEAEVVGRMLIEEGKIVIELLPEVGELARFEDPHSEYPTTLPTWEIRQL